jgi:hypothetical protein
MMYCTIELNSVDNKVLSNTSAVLQYLSYKNKLKSDKYLRMKGVYI